MSEMKPWVKRHPYVALALLVLLAPIYALYHMLSHLPEAWEDWAYEWTTIWRHARGAE